MSDTDKTGEPFVIKVFRYTRDGTHRQLTYHTGRVVKVYEDRHAKIDLPGGGCVFLDTYEEIEVRPAGGGS